MFIHVAVGHMDASSPITATVVASNFESELTLFFVGYNVPIAEMIKLSSGVRLCVRNSYLEILPSGTFFPREKNSAKRHHTTSKNGQFCCRTRVPPSASFGNISAKNQATKPALEPNGAPGFDAYCCRAPSPISPICISTGIPFTGLCFFLSYHHHHGS